jgi:aromatic ring-opening dioxygenase catalytic subunit (LigB family)
MDSNPPDTWKKMGQWLSALPAQIGVHPAAIVVISGHWEEDPVAINAQPAPALLYDYYGFPEHTYQLTYPAPGEPALARRIAQLLGAAGFATRAETRRGFDHGVFIPCKLIFPNADVPIVQLSLRKGLDPAEHLCMGRALAPLRRENVLIVGSGMSFHNLRAFGPAAESPAEEFDEWLTATVCLPNPELCDLGLTEWRRAPSARFCHPREEHLLPLMVAAGAAGNSLGKKIFQDRVMGATVSAFAFGLTHPFGLTHQ